MTDSRLSLVLASANREPSRQVTWKVTRTRPEYSGKYLTKKVKGVAEGNASSPNVFSIVTGL